MSWKCPECQWENPTGTKLCAGCAEVELSPPSDIDTEPEPPAKTFTKEEIEILQAQSERFTSLIRGKSLSDIVNQKMFDSTDVFIHSSAVSMQHGQDPIVLLVMAIAWGMFVAENGGSKLGSRESSLLLQ